MGGNGEAELFDLGLGGDPQGFTRTRTEHSPTIYFPVSNSTSNNVSIERRTDDELKPHCWLKRLRQSPLVTLSSEIQKSTLDVLLLLEV